MFSNIITVIRATFRDLFSYVWPLTKRGNAIRASLIAILVVGGVTFANRGSEAVTEPIDTIPTVRTATAAEIATEGGVTFLGSVRAVNEATIQSEVGGRVTSVRVEAGDTVGAGAIIATLENASEQAAVLQAQGSYEAALAAAQQSDSGVRDAATSLLAAKNDAVAALRSAYTAANNALITAVDPFYVNPQSPLPSIAVGNTGHTDTLISERKAFRDIMMDWQASATEADTNSDLMDLINEAISRTERLVAVVDILIEVTARADADDMLNGQTVVSYNDDVLAARTALNGSIANLENARTSLRSAEEAIVRAEIGGTSSDVSAANAQVKQALGTLRAAQANLEKTILRTPISGTVALLSVKVGDYMSALTPAAKVTSTGGLEISIFVGEGDRELFALGDTVGIDGTATGTVVSIAPAIDPTTLKSEVKIATNDADLVNGDTVSVSKAVTTTAADATVRVPITALKFNDRNGSMFIVDETNKLVAVPVTVGTVSGSFVTILEGIDATTEFVVDVRGKSAGLEVEVVAQ